MFEDWGISFTLRLSLVCLWNFSYESKNIIRDKSEIRPLYKRHRGLERELARLTAASSPSAGDPATSTDGSSAAAPPQETTTDDMDPTAMILSPASSKGEMVASTPPDGNDINSDDEPEQGVDGKHDSSLERGRSIDATKPVAGEDGATAGLLSPLLSLSPDRSVARETGDERSGAAGVEEEKGWSQAAAVGGKDDASVEEQSEGVKPDGNGGDKLERVQAGKNLVLDVQSEENDASDGAERTAPNTAIQDCNTPLPFSTGSPLVTSDNTSSNSEQGNEEKQSDDGINGKDKPMTAQEGRVRRMRARFLDMKSLIDDEPALPSSPTSAGGKSPRRELDYGLGGTKEDEGASANAISIKGIRYTAVLVRFLTPQRRVMDVCFPCFTSTFDVSCAPNPTSPSPHYDRTNIIVSVAVPNTAVQASDLRLINIYQYTCKRFVLVVCFFVLKTPNITPSWR